VSRTAGPAVPAGRSAENNLLSGLYQQVTEQQAGSLGAGYDLTAGLARYRSWLHERTLARLPTVPSRPSTPSTTGPGPARLSAGHGPGCGREPSRTRSSPCTMPGASCRTTDVPWPTCAVA